MSQGKKKIKEELSVHSLPQSPKTPFSLENFQEQVVSCEEYTWNVRPKDFVYRLALKLIII